MTKFGKHPDKDIVDLGVRGDPGRARRRRRDDEGHRRHRRRQPDGPRRHRPAAAEAGRPDRHPRLQRVERLRHRRHRAAHRDHGGQGGRGRLRPRGRRREACRCRPAGAAASRAADDDAWTPSGRYGAVAPIDGRIGTETMPGVFAQIGMEYGHRYGGTSFELFARISEKNHSHSTLNPLAAYSKAMSLEQIMGDVMIAYPNTRPMCSANCDGAAAAVVVNGARRSRRCRSSSSAGRSRSRRRSSPPTRGRRRARCCPTSTR